MNALISWSHYATMDLLFMRGLIIYGESLFGLAALINYSRPLFPVYGPVLGKHPAMGHQVNFPVVFSCEYLGRVSEILRRLMLNPDLKGLSRHPTWIHSCYLI